MRTSGIEHIAVPHMYDPGQRWTAPSSRSARVADEAA